MALINAILWRFGGSDIKLLGRQWRRVGYPILAFLFSLDKLSVIESLIFAGLCHLTTRLPLTLIGNSISGIINWVWVWAYGVILCLPFLLFGITLPLQSAENAITISAILTLSNLRITRRFFPHEAYEVITGYVLFCW